MKQLSCLLVLCCLLIASPLWASADKEEQQTAEGKIALAELLQEFRALKKEVEALRERLRNLEESQAGREPAQEVQQNRGVDVSQKEQESRAPISELRENLSEIDKRTEGAVTSSAKFPVKIYGIILMNSFYNSRGVAPVDVPLFAEPKSAPREVNTRTVGATARQTRLGFQYQTKVGEASLTGTFEVDLFGGFAGVGPGVAFNLFRLRKASARLDFPNTSFVFGQDFTAFSPLVPNSLSGIAVHTLGASGELIANRPPLIRVERRTSLDEATQFLLQAEVSEPNVGDLSVFTPSRRPGAGERGGQPAYVIRASFTHKVGQRQAAIGIAGRYNKLQVAAQENEQRIDGYGLSVDWIIPIATKLALRGEFFRGRALGIFFGGVGQNFTLFPGGAIRGVNSTGGWLELGYDYSEKLSFHGAYGIDNPRARDLTTGMRSKNRSFFVNGMYKFSPHWTFALEYHRVMTEFMNQRFNNADVNIVNAAFGFTF